MLASLLLLSCSENVLMEKLTLEPNIQVFPTVINFDDTKVLDGETSHETFWIINSGTDTLSVFIEEDSEIFSFDEYSFEIEPQEELEVDVYFTPKYYFDYSYFVSLESNDPDEPNVMVNLKGLGLSPGIKVSSFIHNFETNIGCESSKEFTIQNIGNDTLTVDNIACLNFSLKLSSLFI